MDISVNAGLLAIYGTFLMLCGIIAVTFIGLRAKTALLSGSFAGLMSFGAAYLIKTEVAGAAYVGIAVSLALFGVFAWRSTKTLFTVFELIPEKAPELKGKGIAFLIISLMAVVSVFVTLLQVLHLLS